MATNIPKKRESLSQSVSQSKEAKRHIDVVDYEEYQQQQQKAKNIPSSKDDLMLSTFGKTGKKRRFSTRPGKGSIRSNFMYDQVVRELRTPVVRAQKRNSLKGRSKSPMTMPSPSLTNLNQRQFTPPLTAMGVPIRSPSNTEMNINPLAKRHSGSNHPTFHSLQQTQSYQSPLSESTPHLFQKLNSNTFTSPIPIHPQSQNGPNSQPPSPIPSMRHSVVSSSNEHPLRSRHQQNKRHRSTTSATISTVNGPKKRMNFTKPTLIINPLSDLNDKRPSSARSASNISNQYGNAVPDRPRSHRLSLQRRSSSFVQLVDTQLSRPNSNTSQFPQSATPPPTTSLVTAVSSTSNVHDSISPVVLPLTLQPHRSSHKMNMQNVINNKGVTFSPSTSTRGPVALFKRRQSRSKSDVHKYKRGHFQFGPSQTDSDIEPDGTVNVNYNFRPQHVPPQRPLSATHKSQNSGNPYFDSAPRLLPHSVSNKPVTAKSAQSLVSVASPGPLHLSSNVASPGSLYTGVNGVSSGKRENRVRKQSLMNSGKAMELLTGASKASMTRINASGNAGDQTSDQPMTFKIPDLNGNVSDGNLSSPTSSVDGHPGSVMSGHTEYGGDISVANVTPSERVDRTVKVSSAQDILSESSKDIIPRAATDFMNPSSKNKLNNKPKNGLKNGMKRPGTFHHQMMANKAPKSKQTKQSKRERAEQLQREKEERKRAEEEQARLRQIERKKNLERDLDNFQYDRWQKHCIALTFSLPALEAAFKKYHQHHHVVLIKIYIISSFIANIAIWAFYNVPSMEHQNVLNALLSLFNLAFTLLFVAIFGFLFWSKRLIECQSEAMIVFNLCIALSTLVSSALGGEPGYGAYIIIMFCIHLFCGMRHQIASALCWFIAFAFAIMSAILTSMDVDTQNNANIQSLYWQSYAEQVAYLWFTALCLSIMGIHMELSARRQFYQRKKLQHEKKKSWRALSTLLPPDVAKSLQDGKRVAVAFKYERGHPRFKGVSVGFVQICDFHELVSKLPSRNLVTMLNNIFTKWDEFASLHRVFKVETINEIYMVAGGLPYPKIDGSEYAHPIRMVFFANDLMNYCSEVLKVFVPETQLENEAVEEEEKRADGPGRSMMKRINSVTTPTPNQLPLSFRIRQQTQKLQIRCGLNIGYVVAGVIGKQLPRYRLFGDTVNTASRMESTCGPSQIQMTEKFYNELPETFQQYTEKRENVQVKGKGLMTTYLLKKIDRDDHKLNVAPMSATLQDQIVPALVSGIDDGDVIPHADSVSKPSMSGKPSIEIPVLQPNSAIPQTSSGIQMHAPGGLLGLLTLVEDDEPSMNESIHSQLSLSKPPELSNLKIPGGSLQLNPQSLSAPDTPQSGLVPTNSNHGDSNNVNIRIDPPDVHQSTTLESLKPSLHSADEAETDSLRSQYRTKALIAKHRRNPSKRTAMQRRMKLRSSRKNVYDEMHDKKGSDLAVRFMEDHYRQSSLKKQRQKPRPKLSRTTASSRDLRERYQSQRQQIRRNKSLRGLGLWSLPKRDSVQAKREYDAKRRQIRMEKRKSDKRRGLMADIEEEELDAMGLPTTTTSHTRSRSQGTDLADAQMPFEPVLSKSNSFVKVTKVPKIEVKRHSVGPTASVGAVKSAKSRAKTPTAADLSSDRKVKRPHKYAVKHRMTKLSHQRLSPHSRSPTDEDTQSPRSHLHAATVDLRKFKKSDLQRIRRRTSISSSSVRADNEDNVEDYADGDDDRRASFSGSASSAMVSSVTDDPNDRGFMSDPGMSSQRGGDVGGHEHKSKVLVVDNIDEDYDSPQNGAFVDNQDSDDLFGAENIDEFDTDSDVMLANRFNDQQSAANGGRITPPAVSTPSVASSDVTSLSAMDATKRVSSAQPNLKSVPETHSEKTDSAL